MEEHETKFQIFEKEDDRNGIIGVSIKNKSEDEKLLNSSQSSNTYPSEKNDKFEIFPEQLKIYYKRLFPYDTFCRWLDYSHEVAFYNYKTFQHREFCFTLDGGVYLRFNSYNTKEDFINAIQKRNPLKIDLGAEYNKPSHEMFKIIPERKEVVIDIDISDYNDVRKCCKGAEVCQKCWKYMNLACKILDITLRDDFGFKHILWVFSGRRGIHCWVCDTKARHLDARSRSTVAEYLDSRNKLKYLFENRKDNAPMYCIKRAVDIIDQSFIEICIEDQKLLETIEDVNKFLDIIPSSFRKSFENELMKYKTSLDRWNAVVNHFEFLKSKNCLPYNMLNMIHYIKVKWCYPRLDIEVTKGLNHLLKSPFCVHPDTGKICVPINPNSIEKFNPSTVPIIETLLDEINAFDAKLDPEVPDFNVKTIKDARKTSLIKSLVIFEQFVSKLENQQKGADIDF